MFYMTKEQVDRGVLRLRAAGLSTLDVEIIKQALLYAYTYTEAKPESMPQEIKPLQLPQVIPAKYAGPAALNDVPQTQAKFTAMRNVLKTISGYGHTETPACGGTSKMCPRCLAAAALKDLEL